MMYGMAVNDAILYVETANQLRRGGMERKAALIRAGSDRLRPMLVTTLTTVLGMVPMAAMGGEGSELRAPIAITVIGGMLSSTFFTLTCIPAVYMLIDRFRPGGGLKPPKDPSAAIT
jgi:HAE1 family hydrophobic/amphiphilic exporter-1